MASVINGIARKWDFTRNENLLYGRVNGIFVNLTFVKHIRENVSLDYDKLAAVTLFEALFQPKYDHVTVDAYVDREGEADTPELSGFLADNYESFKTSLPTYINGHFGITLYQRDTVNVKAWYVIDFLNFLTGFLSEHGYFSGCQKCGGNGNLSQVIKAGRTVEICESCRLKDGKL